MSNQFLKFRWAGLAIACLMAVSCTNNANPDDTTANGATDGVSKLERVLEKQEIVCGVNGQLPGFSFVDDAGNYSGLDIDFCRAVAAALFDDPDAVQFRDLSTQERLEMVQNEEVDLA